MGKFCRSKYIALIVLFYGILFGNIFIKGWTFGFNDDFYDHGESQHAGKRCPYDVLGIQKSSSHKEVRKAFLKLSKKYHPDLNSEPDAADKFKEINEAYEILSNNDKREAYDAHGFAGLDRLGRMNDMGGDGDFDFDNIFSSFFGGGFGYGGSREPRKAESLVYPVSLSLDMLYSGHEFEVKLEIPRLCKKYDECEVRRPDCHGPQIRVVTQQRGPGMFVQHQMKDPTCIGRNKGWKEGCKACPNGPNYMEKMTLTVTVEPGSRHEQKIVFEGKGQEQPGMQRGNIIFVINEKPHPKYKRDGNDLHCDLDITLKESLLGFSKNLDIFGKDSILVTQSGITPHNNIIKISGKGMPILGSSRFGNLYITINVIYPKKLSTSQIHLLEKAL
ncbi:DnaJ domain containing protein [Theileria equi strain WA]|uniref:DnaJ domain containing protein n=1 Tax=Theileria equi strain WA TaxID=1537102 RepID=L0AZ96_THEEQ|nr:DnaJ domain containing protein [Theileria equi strain WA]AFZ80583.1 DnaJ domain containing protein [Theileria equi strain WA]|eukprot:XP_004830249.1 DnaJ domain containing protein [Theileria equi strain WA]